MNKFRIFCMLMVALFSIAISSALAANPVRVKNAPASEIALKAVKNNATTKDVIDLNSIKLKSESATQAVGDTLLLEGFEGFNSTTGWLPEGWTVINTNTTPGSNWTIGVPYQLRSSYSKYIAAVNADGFNSSDEWLISPEITLGKQNDLIFYALSKPSEMYSRNNQGAIQKDKVKSTLKVKLFVNDSWVEVYDIARDTEYSDEEIESPGYRLTRIKLDDYAGKTIKIAFVYEGYDGATIGIDDVFVGNLYPDAWYLRPEGTYYIGISEKFVFSPGPGFFVPAYTDMYFDNISLYADNYSWIGLDMNSIPYMESNSYSPLFSASPGFLTLPYLEASLDGKTDAYQYSYSGRSYLKVGHAGPAMNVDIRLGLNTYKSGNDYLFGTQKYTPTQAEKDQGYLAYTNEGVGNHFEKPAHPVLIDSVDVFLGELSGPGSTPLTLTLMKVEDNGSLTPIATAKTLISQAKTNTNYKVLSFKFDEIQCVNYKSFYLLSGFNVDGVTLGAMTNSYSDYDESNAFTWVKFSDGSLSLQNSRDRYNYGFSLLFVPYMSFPVLHPDKEVIICETSAGTTQLKVEVSYGLNSLEGLIDNDDSWFRIKKSTLDASFTEDKNSYLLKMDIEYDALPQEMEGRSTNFRIIQKGYQTLTIPVKQGIVLGIDKTTLSAFSAVNTGSAFLLTYDNADKVEVYNISGQKVMQAVLPSDGTYTLEHGQLPSGIYIIKFMGVKGFNNVKVMK